MTENLFNAKYCEVIIKREGDTVWVNTENGCVCRVQGIENLLILDERVVKERTGYQVVRYPEEV
jgi:hypothetical protein